MRRAPVRPCRHENDEDMDVATKAHMKSVTLENFTFSVKRGLDTDAPLNRKAVGEKHKNNVAFFMSLLLPTARKKTGAEKNRAQRVVHGRYTWRTGGGG